MEGYTRREFMKVGLTAGAIGAGAFAAYKLYKNPHEQNENFEELDEFDKEVLGYMAFVELERDELLFVDEDNVPVGPPQKFREFIDRKTKSNGEVIDKYLYSPGPVDEYGVLKGDLPREWMDYLQEEVQKDYPGQSIRRRHHAIDDFQWALNNGDEPDLQKQVQTGEVEEYIDIVKYFADTPVIGFESSSRYEYVQQAVQFISEKGGEKSRMSEVLQTEIKSLLPGLCAQESKFNNGLVSKDGARGIFQFMPRTWEAYGGTDEDVKSLMKQVEIVGQLFNDMYIEVVHHAGEDALTDILHMFPSREAYEKDFIAPLLITAYNAGSKRVGKAVSLYVANNSLPRTTSGKELFRKVIDFAEQSDGGDTKDEKLLANYRSAAREYAPRVYAKAAVLAEEYKK